MKTVTIHAAKTNLSKLVAEVEKGGEVVIARGDKPVARLVPIETISAGSEDGVIEDDALKRRGFGSMKGLIELDDAFFDPLPEEELRAWEGD